MTLADRIEALASKIKSDDPWLVHYLLGWAGYQVGQPWGAATSFAMETAYNLCLIVSAR